MGRTYWGVRANTVRCSTRPAIVWITWMPVAPTPTTPTRLPVQVHVLARPAGGVEDSARGSSPGPRNRFSDSGADSIPAARDQELRVDRLAAVGADGPAAAVLVEPRAGDRGRELDVAAQVEAVGDVMHPPLDLAAGPGNFWLQLQPL